jgi:hypothetical protein
MEGLARTNKVDRRLRSLPVLALYISRVPAAAREPAAVLPVELPSSSTRYVDEYDVTISYVRPPALIFLTDMTDQQRQSRQEIGWLALLGRVY